MITSQILKSVGFTKTQKSFDSKNTFVMGVTFNLLGSAT